MKYSMWKFRPFCCSCCRVLFGVFASAALIRRRSTENMPKVTFRKKHCSALLYTSQILTHNDDGMWSDLSPSPPRNNFPSQKHTKSFSFWEGHERGGEKIINYIPLLLHFIWSRIGVSPKAPPNLYQQSKFFRAFVQKCGRVRRIIKKFLLAFGCGWTKKESSSAVNFQLNWWTSFDKMKISKAFVDLSSLFVSNLT